MKERLWSTYYWIMVGYLAMALVVLLTFKLTWNDREESNACGHFNYDEGRRADCSQGANTPYFIRDINDILFFRFVDYGSSKCDKTNCKEGYDLDRWSYIQNYYPFLLVFIMTLIRFIFTGKHIWQRP
tara:strand:- start:424 stop:807 length:384 start_codon:yes stop_codon:yes gene_type:complete